MNSLRDKFLFRREKKIVTTKQFTIFIIIICYELRLILLYDHTLPIKKMNTKKNKEQKTKNNRECKNIDVPLTVQQQ